VRIGDIDGFGYGAATGFHAANGGPANALGSSVLSNGDFLPDLNRDGSVSTGSSDDFDLRSASEKNDTANTAGTGVTINSGTKGSNFTDIALSTSFDSSSAANKVLTGVNPSTFGAGGPFPSPPSTTLPNQPGFVFSFQADKSVISAGTPIFFNLVFGDFDVVPAQVTLTEADGATKVLTLQVQNNNQGQDGLIQAATTGLTFGDVFSDGGSTWNGFLKVDFIAPNEPYTAFDYVELSTIPLVTPAPEPSTMAMSFIGIAVGLGYRWRRRKADA
jgi:hypothetical protein